MSVVEAGSFIILVLWDTSYGILSFTEHSRLPSSTKQRNHATGQAQRIHVAIHTRCCRQGLIGPREQLFGAMLECPWRRKEPHKVQNQILKLLGLYSLSGIRLNEAVILNMPALMDWGVEGSVVQRVVTRTIPLTLARLRFHTVFPATSEPGIPPEIARIIDEACRLNASVCLGSIESLQATSRRRFSGKHELFPGTSFWFPESHGLLFVISAAGYAALLSAQKQGLG
ncbi:predicted protein [Histoplasma capsulatum G186AR]|uniref:Uncharacterized protein n=1 Tax=Ajellomyces capsulatus (strain G186AR / H82 / ATCC MYA-2454 / RMSCC 2432) TaxID=447093 RepID=C0NPI4_AJECG|nr:uncharacterized protein HCBG_05064 [Histoplasma capsulatum G186AR]EEH06844.1 predicted protein [Histoplasma capsulatum G186AR]